MLSTIENFLLSGVFNDQFQVRPLVVNSNRRKSKCNLSTDIVLANHIRTDFMFLERENILLTEQYFLAKVQMGGNIVSLLFVRVLCIFPCLRITPQVLLSGFQTSKVNEKIICSCLNIIVS